MMDKISRKDAHDSAMVHFFTGIPCKRGHVAPRLVLSGNCVECNRSARPHRKRSEAIGNRAIKVTMIVPKNHVMAMRQIAASFCALEGILPARPPTPAVTGDSTAPQACRATKHSP